MCHFFKIDLITMEFADLGKKRKGRERLPAHHNLVSLPSFHCFAKLINSAAVVSQLVSIFI
jgi:hypothetical protein